MVLDFAPGDRVRYVGGGDTERPYFIGKTGTFMYLDSPGEAVVDFTNTEGVYGENAKTVYPYQLELYKEKAMPDFNIGDKVIVSNNDAKVYETDRFIGLTGYVLSYGGESNVRVTVSKAHDAGYPYNYKVGNVVNLSASTLQLVKENNMSTFAYTDSWVGDSSVIDSAFFDEGDGNVLVKFVSYGSVPRIYYDVSKSTWNNWKANRSFGSFYNSSIKGFYANDPVDKRVTVLRQSTLAPVTKTVTQSKFSVTVSVAGTAEVSVTADNLMDAVKAAQDKFAADGFTVTVISATAL